MRGSWPFTFNIFLFGGYAFVLPFLVLYYQNAGFTGAQIGVLTGITPIITMLGTSAWTTLADASRQHRLMLSSALLVSALTLFSFPFFKAFAPILLIAVLYYLSYGPIPSLADSATLYMLAEKKEMYGRVRVGGTIGFGVAALVAGLLVQRYGLTVAFWGGAVLMLMATLASQKLIHNPTVAMQSTRQGIRLLVWNRRWLLFLSLAFAGGVAMAGTNTFLFPFMKELGASESMMGLAMTIATISEVPVLFFGHHLVRRLRPFQLLVLAIVFTGLRLLAFAASTTPDMILVVQLLNGLAFPTMWLAGVTYAYEHAPAGMGATAQGMFSAMVFGFGSAVGGFAGGPLLENLGGRGLYNLFGVTVLSVVIVVLALHRYLPKEPSDQVVRAVK